MPLALFDLDNTLIAGDSDHLWGDFLVEQGLVDAELYKQANDRFYAEYKRGELDIDEFLAFSLKPLSQHSMAKLSTLHQGFMLSKIQQIILPKAQDLIEKHRQQGDTLLIITATNQFVTQPIATHLGIDNLLATQPEIVNQRYSGKVHGIPCFQQGKVERLQSWLTTHKQNLQESSFYSDSHNDLPLLRQVTYPVAVDPDPILKKHAEQHNWPIMTLR
jgi:HAD superfamily hydrolase (TIGR01490 family)